MENDGKAFEILQALAQAYNQTMTPTQVRLMTQSLDGISPHALELAAAEYMRTSEWFPKAADLRKLAMEYQAVQFGDQLEAGVHALEAAFAQRREYDPATAEHIAVLYERAGRDAKAEWVRSKARRWAGVLASENHAIRAAA